MYNVQMYNVQKDNVQTDNVLNMSADKLGGDPDLFLAPSKEDEGQYLLRPLGKTPSNQFQALPFVFRSPFFVCFDDI